MPLQCYVGNFGPFCSPEKEIRGSNERWLYSRVEEEGWGGHRIIRMGQEWPRTDCSRSCIFFLFSVFSLSFGMLTLVLSFPHICFHIPSFFLRVVLSGVPEPHTLPWAPPMPYLWPHPHLAPAFSCAGCLSSHPNFSPLISFSRIAPSCPGQVAQLVGVSSCTSKGFWFDPRSGHIPRLRVRSPVGACMVCNELMFLSLFLFL